MTDRTELKHLANEAADERWTADGRLVIGWAGEEYTVATCGAEAGRAVENAAFIAAASPTVVLELIAENEQLAAQVRLAGVAAEMAVHDAVGRAANDYLLVTIERDQLKAEVERLRSQVETLQADPNSWQSGYDEGRRMGTKTNLAEIEALRRKVSELSLLNIPPVTRQYASCYACGEHHMGMAGLPCPKMSATAQDSHQNPLGLDLSDASFDLATGNDRTVAAVHGHFRGRRIVMPLDLPGISSLAAAFGEPPKPQYMRMFWPLSMLDQPDHPDETDGPGSGAKIDDWSLKGVHLYPCETDTPAPSLRRKPAPKGPRGRWGGVK